MLAVDGGNSKLDAVVLSAGGRVLGAARGGGASFSPHDHERSFAVLDRTVQHALRAAGHRPRAHAGGATSPCCAWPAPTCRWTTAGC